MEKNFLPVEVKEKVKGVDGTIISPFLEKFKNEKTIPSLVDLFEKINQIEIHYLKRIQIVRKKMQNFCKEDIGKECFFNCLNIKQNIYDIFKNGSGIENAIAKDLFKWYKFSENLSSLFLDESWKKMVETLFILSNVLDTLYKLLWFAYEIWHGKEGRINNLIKTIDIMWEVLVEAIKFEKNNSRYREIISEAIWIYKFWLTKLYEYYFYPLYSFIYKKEIKWIENKAKQLPEIVSKLEDIDYYLPKNALVLYENFYHNLESFKEAGYCQNCNISPIIIETVKIYLKERKKFFDGIKL